MFTCLHEAQNGKIFSVMIAPRLIQLSLTAGIWRKRSLARGVKGPVLVNNRNLCITLATRAFGLLVEHKLSCLTNKEFTLT